MTDLTLVLLTIFVVFVCATILVGLSKALESRPVRVQATRPVARRPRIDA